VIRKEKVIVIDVDGTLCGIRRADQTYDDVPPISAVVSKLREYKRNGFYIALYSSRNMNAYDGNIGLINANTAPTLIAWLKRHDVPFDEIYFGKPWPGNGGFYVDDRAVRPDEFVNLDYNALMKLLGDA